MELNPGYKQTDVGVIPEDWDAVPLRRICRAIYRGASPRPIGDPRWFDQGSDIGWVRISDVTRSRRYLRETTQRLSEEGIKQSRFIPRGSLIMSICATVGRPIETAVNTCIHDGFVVFEKPGVDQGFLYHVLCDLEPRWATKGQTGSQMNLNTNLIKITSIPLPPTEEEQRAIATALSDANALLNGLDRLIAKKRDLKQAAMQQLLTGKTRLPGFEENWRSAYLPDVLDIRKGELMTSSQLREGNIPVVAGGINPAYYHDTSNRLGSCVTISASGANAGFVAFYQEPIFASDCSTIESSDYISAKFAYYKLKLYQAELFSLQSGGAQPHVQPNDLTRLIISFPNRIEQDAIVSILSDMDAEISAFENRRNKSKDIKQAMMQELLTGKTRLVTPRESNV